MRTFHFSLFLVAACGTSGTTLDSGVADVSTVDAGDAQSVHDTGPVDDVITSDAPADGGDVDAPDDASDDVSTYDGPLPFSCGSLVCLPTEYCTAAHGLVSLDGGGVYTGYSCTALPKKCEPTPTCSCLTTVGPCSCTANGSDLTVNCYY